VSACPGLHPIGDGGQLAKLSQPAAMAVKRARTPPAAAAIKALTHSFMALPPFFTAPIRPHVDMPTRLRQAMRLRRRSPARHARAGREL
jgi:hypothetical protein